MSPFTYDQLNVRIESAIDRVCLDQESFRKIICIERKRAERSQRSFVLMLLDVSRLLADDEDDRKLTNLVSSLSASIRDTDVIGWHTRLATLGVIFTEVASETRKSIVGRMQARATSILYGKLTFDQFNEISISQHVFPEEWDHDVPQRPSHPSLYPDLCDEDAAGTLFLAVKRAIDITASGIALLLCIPLFLLIALAIKFSSQGPVLFRQIRVGQYGRPFMFLKFRSMYVGNDPSIHLQYVRALISGRVEHEESSGPIRNVYKLTKDPRVTRVGRFLRKSSLDELPQLFNVLKGEMSLVGPRPAIPYEVQAYEPWHRRRVLEAKPGITGLWQVKGRSRVTFDDMVRLDVRYAMTRSLWLDLEILVATPRAVLLASGAY